MEHLLKIASGRELAERKHVNVKNMKILRTRKNINYNGEWDSYYLITGFLEPKYQPNFMKK
tara:strand:+ start:6671 stop:6853 length:183 start_codon:yes stop_codon:yes gene_type:complete